MFTTVIGRILAPKNVHVLISRTCEYVTLHRKRDFVDEIKDKDLEMEKLSWLLGGLNLLTWVLEVEEGNKRVNQKNGSVRRILRCRGLHARTENSKS